MDKSRLLFLVELVEDAFNRYGCDYGFEEGVIYTDNGRPEDVEEEALKRDTHDLICQLEEDCKNLLDSREYEKTRDNLKILERLNTLDIELNK